MNEIYPNREGYYWIKVRFYDPVGRPFEQWVIGYWRSEEHWERVSDEPLELSDVIELGDEIEVPEKYRD